MFWVDFKQQHYKNANFALSREASTTIYGMLELKHSVFGKWLVAIIHIGLFLFVWIMYKKEEPSPSAQVKNCAFVT